MNSSPDSTSARARMSQVFGFAVRGASVTNKPPAFQTSAPSSRRTFWNHRQQQIRLVFATRVDRVRARIVVGVIVQIRLTAHAITRLHVELDAVALLEHHRGRPDLDIDLHD